MTYCFRLRFDLHGMMRIGSDHEARMLEDSDRERVTLESTDPGDHAGSSRVVVEGCGYQSAELARDAGAEWLPVLQRAFASLGVGADLGGRRVRAPWSSISRSAAYFGENEESPSRPRFVYDEPGLTVFTEDPRPLFVQSSSSGWAGRAPSTLAEAIAAVRQAAAPLSPVEQTAYELWSSSFSAVSIDARFLVLMMAIETLIEPQGRGDVVLTHVDTLIEQTRRSGLPQPELDSCLARWITCVGNRSVRQDDAW
jgi:hypothetical protein